MTLLHPKLPRYGADLGGLDDRHALDLLQRLFHQLVGLELHSIGGAGLDAVPQFLELGGEENFFLQAVLTLLGLAADVALNLVACRSPCR
jgi:hypothetical protein